MKQTVICEKCGHYIEVPVHKSHEEIEREKRVVEAKKMSLKGKSLREIGRNIGVSRMTVRRYLLSQGG